MGRGIITSIIDVDECSVNDWHRLEEVCQHLAKIVTVLERCRSREHNIDLDEEFVTSVIGAQILNLTNGSGEAHGQV